MITDQIGPHSVLLPLLINIKFYYRYTISRDQTKHDPLVLRGGRMVRHEGGPARVIPSVETKHGRETKIHVPIGCQT